MRRFFKRFWTDEAYFLAAIRGFIALIGAGIATGVIPLAPLAEWLFGDRAAAEAWKTGFLAMVAAHFIPAGEKNLKPDVPPHRD